MRFTSTYLDGLGVVVPEPRPIAEWIADGALTAEEADEWGWTGACVVGDVAPTAMAITAGRGAVAESSVPVDRYELLVHTGSFVQGGLGWPAHHHVQREVLGDHGTAIEVRQSCTGGLIALQLAAATLRACDHPAAVLVTGADNCFWFDRFEWVRHHAHGGRAGLLHGDAAHGVTLSNTGGFAELRSVVARSVPDFEQLYRHPGPQFPVPLAVPTEDEWRAITAATTLTEHDSRVLGVRAARAALDAVATALDDARISAEDVTLFIPSFDTSRILPDFICGRIPMPRSDVLDQFGRLTGHLTVSDHTVAIDWLRRRGELSSGDNLVLLGMGQAASYVAAVVTIT
ncbi:3-oxoacyl-[acyl-carrier-protein] synthase III C-terminal domain-containing protein [Williamsia sp.]|uniref:3-oxoacyl-[acyl-carrier-protein] synthase III C-terminal domain-containing protein n=1 Tax=Williamsia sp. TaxID=1872085 RepID=UPI001A1CE482|nr:3-oxoacyl-[acyl-carrier-protein] synthase III C-terminal domain-containing protein [Williamsia sp.]MBJ7290271.1 hypothetical protein [Williamsia sp.]